MATGQTLLNLMEDLDSELQLQSGEANVAKGLRMLNAAQDMMETVIAKYPLGKWGKVGILTTTNLTEATAFPTGVLRIDQLQLMDTSVTPNMPKADLDNLQETGSHAWNRQFPYNLVYTAGSSGAPQAYWTNGSNIYWSPVPDGIYTIRWYGFQQADDITASGTFAYDDACLYPLATLAVKMIKVGLDDPIQDLTSQAKELFDPLMEALADFNRTGALGYAYRYTHNT